MIKCFNTADIYSKEQDAQFNKAVEFAQTVLISMKNMQEDKLFAREIVANSFIFNRNPEIIELEQFTPHWGSYINGDKLPHIKAVVWEDVVEDNWKVRIPSVRQGSFELNGKPLFYYSF